MKKYYAIFAATLIASAVPTSSAYAGTRAGAQSDVSSGSVSHRWEGKKSARAGSMNLKYNNMRKPKDLPPGLVGKCFDPEFPGAKGIEKVCRRKSGGSG